MSSIVSIKEQNQVAKSDRANTCHLFTLSGPHIIIVNYLELKSLVQLNYALGIQNCCNWTCTMRSRGTKTYESILQSFEVISMEHYSVS